MREAQSGQHFARPSVERIAAQLLETALHFAIAFDDLVHLVELVGIGHGVFQRLQFGCDLGHRPCAVHHLGHRRTARHFADILREITDGDAAIGADKPFIGQFLSGHHPEQRRFARAVGADKADLLALQKRCRSLDEQNLVAVLFADILKSDHGENILSIILRAVIMRALMAWGGRSGHRLQPANSL